MRSLLWLAGVLLAVWVPPALLPAWPWLLAVIPVTLVWRRTRAGWLLIAGCVYAHHAIVQVQAPAIADGERRLLLARIDSLPARGDGGWQFDAEVSFPRMPQQPAQRMRLTMPGDASPQVGELWQLAVQFSTPPSAAAARALLRDHISSTGRVRAGPLNRSEAAPASGLDQLRARVATQINARVVDPAAAALLAALAVGATGDVSRQQWQVFSATGITHLVAISGMHVTFFAMMSMALARWLWRRIPWFALRVRRESFAAGTGVLLALGYALLSGFSVPAQRTVVMLAAFLLVRECARASRPAWSVGAALVAVLLYDPLAVLSAGFWLSFAAVAAIVLIAGARLQPAAPLIAAAQLQWLVTLALLPVTLLLFGSFSAVGVLANALAIPVFTFLLVPPVLLATAGYLLPAAPAHWCADQLVDLAAAVAGWLWPLLAQGAQLPGAVWFAWAPLSWYLLALPALLLALAPWTPALRVAGLIALGSVFLLREPRPATGELWLDMLDVGASSAVVLRTRHHLLLYGSGEKYGSGGRAFEAAVLPLLRRSGYGMVDLWLPGPLGRDQQAALASAAAVVQLKRIEVASETDPPPELARCQPRHWQWDGIQFSVATSPARRGCVLLAAVNGRGVQLASETGRGDADVAADGQQDLPPPAVLILPRAASAAAMHRPAAGSVLLATVSSVEWNSAAWRRLRRKYSDEGLAVLATASEGDMQLRMDAEGQVRRPMTARRLLELAGSVFGYDSGS